VDLWHWIGSKGCEPQPLLLFKYYSPDYEQAVPKEFCYNDGDYLKAKNR
jgi:hypothetical protein